MSTSDPDALARAAEEEAAAAEARAEAARARAEELRRRIAQADEGGHTDDTGHTDEGRQGGDDGPADRAETPVPAEPFANASTGSTPSVATAVAMGVAAVLTAGLLGSAGYMVWQHQRNAQQRHSAAEFTAAARQDVINLMSIDYNTAQDSVQRVLDGSTGRFRANFDETAEDFVKALKDEKIITKATVNDAAVESMTADSAVVLVSATSRREGPKAPKDQQEPRLWRVVVTLERVDGQIKMSGVDFV